jgi:hypothetical protein
MPMLPARHYVSEFEQFKAEMDRSDPELDRKRRAARAVWWDKDPGDLELRREMDTGRVAMQPYVYQTE